MHTGSSVPYATTQTRTCWGLWVRYVELVRMRQQPKTASGVTFVMLEDEAGTAFPHDRRGRLYVGLLAGPGAPYDQFV